MEGGKGGCVVGKRWVHMLNPNKHADIKVDQVSMEYVCGGHLGGAPTNGKESASEQLGGESPQAVGEAGGCVQKGSGVQSVRTWQHRKCRPESSPEKPRGSQKRAWKKVVVPKKMRKKHYF